MRRSVVAHEQPHALVVPVEVIEEGCRGLARICVVARRVAVLRQLPRHRRGAELRSSQAVVARQRVGATAQDRALPDTGDIGRDLRSVLRATIEELLDPDTDRLQRTITAEIQHDPVLAEELVARLLRPQMQATADRLRAARDAGQLGADVDVDLAAELLFGPLLHRWLLRTAPLDARYADALVEHVLTGLSPRAE